MTLALQDLTRNQGSSSGKRRAMQEIALMGESKRKKWSVNSTILPRERSSVYFVDPAEIEKNRELLENIHDGKFVLMHGARASGKSTRVWRVMEQLQLSGYFCIYITFTGISVTDVNTLWSGIGDAVSGALCDYFGPGGSLQTNVTVPDIQTTTDFLKICRRQNELWKILAKKRKEQGDSEAMGDTTQPFIVIFMDEFDAIVHAGDITVRDNFLGILHAIKTSGDMYAVKSIVGVGTFNILKLNTDSRLLSPFNVTNAFNNPNFTSEQVKTIFKEFAVEYELEIADEVIEDIFLNTNGHPGLVNLCGRTIQAKFNDRKNPQRNKLSFPKWKIFSGGPLGEQISKYNTFDKMITSLRKESSRKAVDLLRGYFLGRYEDIALVREMDVELAGFLVSEGVLSPVEDKTKTFRVSSPFVDSLVRRRILPGIDSNVPKRAPISRTNGEYCVYDYVVTAASYFNKDVLRMAPIRTFKEAKIGTVGGKSRMDVPQESVYQGELGRILSDWLSTCGLEVTAQWHVSCEGQNSRIQHRYCNIIITSSRNPRHRMTILELLPSGTKAELEEHYSRALMYAGLFQEFKPEVWVINFTCLDGATQSPIWQSDDQLRQGLNVIHIWHNLEFTEMRYSVRYQDNDTTVTHLDQVQELI
ncbi:hypothetical protein BGX20_006216 [Mortierella sp. AD010]|nr:hypothetical protein BGX20_006216 [Mortierella sp. AD010]